MLVAVVGHSCRSPERLCAVQVVWQQALRTLLAAQVLL
jgi:hypothetical protein